MKLTGKANIWSVNEIESTGSYVLNGSIFTGLTKSKKAKYEDVSLFVHMRRPGKLVPLIKALQGAMVEKEPTQVFITDADVTGLKTSSDDNGKTYVSLMASLNSLVIVDTSYQSTQEPANDEAANAESKAEDEFDDDIPF